MYFRPLLHRMNKRLVREISSRGRLNFRGLGLRARPKLGVGEEHPHDARRCCPYSECRSQGKRWWCSERKLCGQGAGDASLSGSSIAVCRFVYELECVVEL